MSGSPALVLMSTTPLLLTLEWADGAVAEFAAVWLRDNLPQDRDPHSGQRLIDVVDLPAEPRIRRAAVVEGSLRVDWEDEAAPGIFDLDWLAQRSEHAAEPPERSVRPWLDGASLDARRDFAHAAFDELQRDAGLRLRWLTGLLQSGISFLSGLPATPEAILEAMALVGRVLETNYGRVFDVRAVPSPENLAYSDLGLGLHTDNPYRDPVPGFQALHVLLAAPDGGESLFADGIALSEHLRAIDRPAFEVLTRTPVPFQYRSKDADLYAERPLIQLDCRGAIAAVHYNSRSIAPLRPAGGAGTFYAAYRRFAGLLRDSRHQLKVRLADGELVLFDNQRILHGRTAFTSARHARHLRGCYLTRDSVHSQAALLRRATTRGETP
jgi:gamma-butyrobetaine dioxygenase